MKVKIFFVVLLFFLFSALITIAFNHPKAQNTLAKAFCFAIISGFLAIFVLVENLCEKAQLQIEKIREDIDKLRNN
jgi:hypothetical protein